MSNSADLRPTFAKLRELWRPTPRLTHEGGTIYRATGSTQHYNVKRRNVPGHAPVWKVMLSTATDTPVKSYSTEAAARANLAAEAKLHAQNNTTNMFADAIARRFDEMERRFDQLEAMIESLPPMAGGSAYRQAAAHFEEAAAAPMMTTRSSKKRKLK